MVAIKKTSTYNLRSSTSIQLEDHSRRSKKTLGDRAFSNASAKIWNSLPQSLQSEQNFSGAPLRAKRGWEEPHTQRIWSTSFRLVVTWLTERTYVRTYASTDCTGRVGETIKRKGGVSPFSSPEPVFSWSRGLKTRGSGSSCYRMSENFWHPLTRAQKLPISLLMLITNFCPSPLHWGKILLPELSPKSGFFVLGFIDNLEAKGEDINKNQLNTLLGCRAETVNR